MTVTKPSSINTGRPEDDRGKAQEAASPELTQEPRTPERIKQKNFTEFEQVGSGVRKPV